MSLTYSVVLEVSASGLSGQECERSRSAKSIPTAAPSSESTGPTCPNTTTSENLPENDSAQMEFFPMSSAAAFHARTSRLRGRVPASPASGADYGRNTPVLLAKFDRNTSSWRTSQLCLDGGLAEFSGTWPRSGMTRNGIAFLLPKLERHTGAIGSGSLLPTPVRAADRWGQHHPLDGGSNARKMLLALLPTITRCGNYNRIGASRTSEDGLYTVLRGTGLKIGTKSCRRFVAWMMGYPEAWTDLPLHFLETPSSRKSPKSSVAQSCKLKD